jgi:CBS domain containing-hemolysin-like protein
VFIWAGARQAVVAATITDRLPSLRITELIRPTLQVPPDLPISEALRRAWQSRAQGLIIIDTAGQAVAVVSEAGVAAVPEQRRPWTPVADVSEPLRPELLVAHTTTGPELFERMRNGRAMEYVVVDAGGQPLGVITAADMARLVQHWRDGADDHRTHPPHPDQPVYPVQPPYPDRSGVPDE